MASLNVLLLLLSLSSSQVTSSEHERIIDQPGNVIIINSDTLPGLIASPSLSLVFFYREETRKTELFLEEYNKSAKYLKQYGITLAVFDCMSDKARETTCNKKNIDNLVFTYRNGISLMSLEIEYLFDVDSIMANALHLLLLHEVPIIQSRLERQELEQSQAGQRDILFIYPQAVGTREHRIFLEIAYAYQDHFSLALTMDPRTVLGLQDSESITTDSVFGLWVMFCSEVTKSYILKEGYCPHTMYRGKPTLFDVAAFVRKLQKKSVFTAPYDGLAFLFEMSSEDPVVYVYIKSKEKQENKEIVNIFTYDLRGSAAVVFVNMDDSQTRTIVRQQGYTSEGPGIGVKTKDNTLHFSNSDDWSVSGLRNFLMPYVFSDWKDLKSPPSSLATSEGFKKSIEALIDDVETQDDQVANAVMKLKHKKIVGLELVPQLLKGVFYRAVRKLPLLVVLFYEPFDHVSLAFLRDFGLAAQILAKNFSTTDVLARVDCFDATDLCSAENVTSYPTTRIYRQNTATHEMYMGPLDALAVMKTVKLLQLNSPLQLTREREVDRFIEGLHPTDFSKFTPSSVLLLAKDSSSEATTVFKEVSSSMAQVTALATVHSSIARKIAEKYSAPVPSLLAFNREDKVKPIRILDLSQFDISAAAMTSFVRAATIPLVPELDQENFPHLFARQQPMTILFVDSSDEKTKEIALASFSSLATLDQFPPSVFCWMDAQVKSLGLQILSEYTWTAQIPMVSVVKHRQGQVFNFLPDSQNTFGNDPIQSGKLADWLLRVLSGEATPSKILEQTKWGPPGPYYNFLDFQENLGIKEDEGPYVEKDFTGPYVEKETISNDNTSEGGEEEQEVGKTVEDEYDFMESNVRDMLLELRKQHQSSQVPKMNDVQADEMSHGKHHGHTEL